MIPGSIRICVPNFAARLQSYGRVEKKGGGGTDRHTHKGTLELERLLCTVILPSCMYGVALYESQMKERDFEYLYVVQGRLIKAWFWVSKFCSTTALREAIRWKRVVFCQLRHGARMGSFVVGEDTQLISFGKHHVRRCMGMWLSNGLHYLWCGAGQCYFVSEECTLHIIFCCCDGVDKYHLLRCIM